MISCVCNIPGEKAYSDDNLEPGEKVCVSSDDDLQVELESNSVEHQHHIPGNHPLKSSTE